MQLKARLGVLCSVFQCCTILCVRMSVFSGMHAQIFVFPMATVNCTWAHVHAVDSTYRGRAKAQLLAVSLQQHMQEFHLLLPRRVRRCLCTS
jgi:hypothetical protein